MADNNARRLASMVSLDLLDPLIEAMLDGVLVPGAGNVSVELNFIPFMVNENDMEHQWHPGPMDVDYDDGEDKEEEEEEEGGHSRVYGYRVDEQDEDEEEEEEEGEGEGEEEEGDEDEEEERHRYHYHHHHHHDYSSQRDYEEDEEEEEEEGEEEEEEGEEDEEGNELEHDYDEGDEEVEEEEEEEYDEDEEELRVGYVDDSIISNYGSLGWSICHNISAKNILDDTYSRSDFLRQMVEYFFKHLKQPTVASISSLHTLLSCLPSLTDLKNLITKTKYTMKEAIIIKVVLELYESYHKTFGAPNFKVYHTEVIPLLLDFYIRQPDAALKLMSKQLTRVLINHNNLVSNFKMYNTKQEYLGYYRESTRRMRNLSEATDPIKFLR